MTRSGSARIHGQRRALRMTIAASRREETSLTRAGISTRILTRLGAAVPAALPTKAVLRDAQRFYAAQLERSWVPAYLASRAIDAAVAALWEFGYAPGGGKRLTYHLHGLGHSDAVIEASGLARRSRGGLADFFRDRVMLPIRDERGSIAGFIGRAAATAGRAVAKYLNTADTGSYRKGDVLFGLHQARQRLGHGAIPVIVEGPFDAIAVAVAAAGRYAAVAPCGTALTSRQVAQLAGVVNLRQRRVIVAFDGDAAGRCGAVTAWRALESVTTMPAAVTLPTGSDPAGVLEAAGPAALAALLQQTLPLADVVIDAHLADWQHVLDSAACQLAAMRMAAEMIAGALPAAVARRIEQITGGRRLTLYDRELRPVARPELEVIARLLPAGAVRQICLLADRLSFDHSEVTAEAASAVTALGRHRHVARPRRWPG